MKRDRTSRFASAESQRWLQNNKEVIFSIKNDAYQYIQEFEEGMNEFYKKKESTLTPAQVKKTLRQIETSPKNTREIVQNMLKNFQTYIFHYCICLSVLDQLLKDQQQLNLRMKVPMMSGKFHIMPNLKLQWIITQEIL